MFSINDNPLFLKNWGYPKLDTFVDEKLPDNVDSASIFSKIIGCELSHSSSADLYLLCCMNFASKAVGTKAPHFVELGIPDVNTLD